MIFTVTLLCTGLIALCISVVGSYTSLFGNNYFNMSMCYKGHLLRSLIILNAFLAIFLTTFNPLHPAKSSIKDKYSIKFWDNLQPNQSILMQTD